MILVFIKNEMISHEVERDDRPVNEKSDNRVDGEIELPARTSAWTAGGTARRGGRQLPF